MAKSGMKPTQALKLREEKGLEITKLQKMRVAKGLSQNDLAAITGVSVRRIQNYEQKTKKIEGARLDVLCDIAIALDCKIEDILEDKAVIAKIRMAK